MNKKYLYSGKIYKIFRKKVSIGQTSFEKDYIEGKDRVIIVPVVKKEKFLMIKFPEYAKTEITFSLRFPRGVIDKGEDPRDAAKRELLEETGYKAENIENLKTCVFPNAAAIQEKWHILIAKNLIHIDDYQKDEFEDWGVVEVSVKEMERMIRNGQISDASAISALYLYKLTSS